MDPYKLIEETGAEIVSNRAVARVGGQRVVIAKVMGNGMTLTADGEELAKTFKPAPKAQNSKAKATGAPAAE